MARNVKDTSETTRRRGRPRNANGAGAGHNSGDAGGIVDSSALSRHVDRLLSLHADRAEINADIKEVYDEAKEAGIVTKILRKIVAEKLMDEEVRHEQYRLMDAYRSELGMLADTPLGQAAMQSDDALQRAREHLGTAE